jgi:adenylosuccinate lyase
VVDRAAIARNLAAYGPFAAVERVLMALGKAGADRQAMHERLRGHALAAWATVQAGQPNPLPGLLADDAGLLAYLSREQLTGLMNVDRYTGDASRRARRLAERLRGALQAAPTPPLTP